MKKITPEIELSQTSFTFNGKQQKPSVIVRDGETVIPEDSYVLTYDENTTNVGTHKVQVDLSGDYEGSNTASYTIKAKKITPVVTLSGTSFVYNGKTRKPAVTVKDGSTKLAASNFTVTYGNGLKNAGTYKVVVKMKGNYSGSKTVTFKITPKKVTPGVTLSKSSFAYNGKAQKPSVTVKDGSTKLAAANYTLTYSKGRVNVGTYKVVVRLKGNYSGSKIVTFKITPKK